MDQGFLRYLFESKNLSRQVVANIEASFGDADYETENKINDIIELLEECELNPNIYLLEYPGLLELAKIEDREELEKIIEYVKEYYKKNKKDKNPYLLIHLMLAAREIVKKEKDEETQKIIALLKREGLMKIFETKNNKSKDRVKVEQILHGDYEIIKRNINILKKEKTYKALVYSNPLILINPNEKEVRKLLEEYIKENSKEDEEQDKEKDEDKDKKDEDKEEEIEKEEEHEEDVEDDADEIDENVEEDKNESQEEEENISGHPISQEEKRLLELGEEEKVLPILVCFNKYGINYDILKSNPEILRRHKIHNIPEIIELLYQNNIPFSVIYACPEILEKGKSDEIAQVIEELKTRGISLTIILTCPEILIKAEPERIRQVCIEFEKNNIDKHLIYSMPSVLISGDIENYIKNINGLDKEFKDDMQYVLDGLPDNYIIFPEMEDKVIKNIDEDSAVRVDMLSDENIHNLSEILIVKNVVSTKQVINTLNDEGIDIDIVNREPKILSQSSDRISSISKVVKGEKLGIAVINREPAVLVKTNIEKFKEILDVLKKYMPEQTKDVLKKLPSIIYRADAKNIEGVLKELQNNEIDFEFVQKTPHILLREDAEEISKIITNLNQKGYTKQQIIDIPEILVLGREKYIDRNVKTFERNNLNIPLHLVYCISARNNEKNIICCIRSTSLRLLRGARGRYGRTSCRC